MPDPAREPETTDEELLEAETAAIARLYTDEDRVERMAGELRSGFATLSGLRPGVSVFGSARTTRDDPQYGEVWVPNAVPTGASDIRLQWSGDVVGQGYGINPDLGGMKIFSTMAARPAPDVSRP